ncbi:MAG: hypothetical protein IJ171_01180 [Ruminococcus sp.]|nr:hypothetical protein [Ruminococcus sp.]
MKKILYLTDLAYRAKGRNYCEEDIYITSRLKDQYGVALCHPKCSESFEKDADLIVFRNTGGVSGFKEIYDSFVLKIRVCSVRARQKKTLGAESVPLYRRRYRFRKAVHRVEHDHKRYPARGRLPNKGRQIAVSRARGSQSLSFAS